MYPRNAASPPKIAIGAVVQISDGAVQSSGVSVVVSPEGGTESAGGGTVSYGGSSNVVYYAPTQAETNYTAFVVTAYKTGCIPVSQTVVTTASATSGKVVLSGETHTSAVIPTVTTTTTATNVTTVNGLANGVITAAAIATDAIDNDAIAADVTAVIADAVWNAATASYGTANTYGALVETNLDGTISSRASQTSVDTVDDFLDTEIAAIKAKTDNLPAAFPNNFADLAITASTGRVTVGTNADKTGYALSSTDVNVATIGGDSTAATNLKRATLGVVTGTVGTGSTTTSIVTSAMSPAATADGQFIGRIVIFDSGTTTAALRGQATDITGSTSGGVLTVTALTTAPVSGDTFTVT